MIAVSIFGVNVFVELQIMFQASFYLGNRTFVAELINQKKGQFLAKIEVTF